MCICIFTFKVDSFLIVWKESCSQLFSDIYANYICSIYNTAYMSGLKPLSTVNKECFFNKSTSYSDVLTVA